MKRFLAELKRRKVIQTAVLYALSAWVLLQVAELLLDMLEVPAWGLKLVFVVLLIGFPLALLLSWMHQVTPEGIRRESAVPEAPRGLPPARAFSSHAADAPAAPMPPEEPAVDERSIAVLPFANLSEDRANEYFADGLSDELLNLLSRVQGLRVIARTSSFSFKGRMASATEIARELKVTHLLEGSVRRSGSRIRITAQLIRARDSSHVWSQSFDRDRRGPRARAQAVRRPGAEGTAHRSARVRAVSAGSAFLLALLHDRIRAGDPRARGRTRD